MARRMPIPVKIATGMANMTSTAQKKIMIVPDSGNRVEVA
jgi:hypothetical protein